ncbi:MAG: glycosyltransferase family 39 protein [Candidatus Pacearchaeota archaeon]
MNKAKDLFERIKKHKLLISILILALILRIIFVFISPVKLWDETIYANLGYELSKNPMHYSFDTNGWSDRITDGSWPKAGFRPPLLPYILSLFFFFNLSNLIEFLIPVIGMLNVLVVYFLGKKIFNYKVGVYSALFLAIFPIHVIYSGKIMTDVFSTFFISLSILFFWIGFEENKNSYKVLFGLSLALALLTRYTSLWIIPVFAIYFLLRDKSFKFLKDKFLWVAILVFFLILSPWFVYSYFTYGNIFGAFIHGFKAVSYWGGIQPWYFFFTNFWEIFSIFSFIFIISLFILVYNKQFLNKKVYFFLIWISLFFIILSYMPHKEPRYFIPIIPAICLICGVALSLLKKYAKIILLVIFIISLVHLFLIFNSGINNEYTETNICFKEGAIFLNGVNEDSVVFSDKSTLGYYFFRKKIITYPEPWNLQILNTFADRYKDREIYLFITDFQEPVLEEDYLNLKKDLNLNFEQIFNCNNKTIIYKYN